MTTTVITSAKNPRILAAKALQHKSARDEAALFLCEGEHMVSEALANAPERIVEAFVDAARADDYRALLDALPQTATLCEVPAHVLQALGTVKTPQGIAATVRMPQPRTLDALGDRLILLENVQDPGNVGTILRTLDAAGFNGCILTAGCADPFSPKGLRATMGSVFRVPMTFADDAASTAARLRADGYAVLAAVLDGSDFYAREPLPPKLCIVIGNEGAGIRPETAAACSHRFRLPMHGGAESLNAAIAAAVMMYDVVNR